ncbi:hypothetical protein MKZ38_004334 [Zalerion maritima]|uniref:Peroxisomal targeting signal receptor n=1 Tax=Zalerion maritima TaxID=339359 RepID=A0AAD5RMD4_9PEZI|nr:hypothetical protein MKZ38_004334 [Zalerion maritima]
MSFAGGAECSSAGNPLSQFQKHVQGGSSLSQDHLINRGPASGAADFRSMPDQSVTQDQAFQQAMAQQDPMLSANPNPHMDPAAHGVHMRAQSASPTWAGPNQMHPSHAAMEAAFEQPGPAGADFSPQDFAKFQAMQNTGSQRASPAPTSQQPMHRPMMGGGMMGMGGMGMGMGLGGMGMMNRPMYSPQANMHQTPAATMSKGKGKEVVELDDHQWEEQFNAITLEDQKAKEEEDQARAMEPELNNMDEKLAHDTETNYGDFESIWKGIQAENEAVTSSGDFHIGDQWNTSDMGGWDTFDGPAGGSSLRNFQEPMIEDYLFEDENIFKGTGDPYAEGLRILNEGGNLSLAALAFEAAVQKDAEHVDAWVHLGSAQAQNEKETAAIRALEQALKLDPQNLAALMGLAVSYTNEGYESTAYRTLERWLSVKYPQVVSPADVSPIAEMGFTDRQQLHDKVTDLFIKAAQLGPGGGDTTHMDPDVQVGLGVLFYGAEEYDKAVDCFSAALASSEQGTVNESSQVHLLWNRLGATLANSGRSEEAINAYEKALSINPNFVRARYNLGVSCINIGCHAEAAGHLLSALSMHKSVEKEGRDKAREILQDANGGGPVDENELDRMTLQNTSTTLYDTLRRVFTQMGRRDLAERVVSGMDPESFRIEFDF